MSREIMLASGYKRTRLQGAPFHNMEAIECYSSLSDKVFMINIIQYKR